MLIYFIQKVFKQSLLFAMFHIIFVLLISNIQFSKHTIYISTLPILPVKTVFIDANQHIIILISQDKNFKTFC